VRELRNVMKRLALAATMFPEKPWKDLLAQIWKPSPSLPVTHSTECMDTIPAGSIHTLKYMTRQFEKAAIRSLLADYDGDQTKVAVLLGISLMSLWRKLRDEMEQ
jgi:transcriptional regulator with PAS, ATPase and Fis domain